MRPGRVVVGAVGARLQRHDAADVLVGLPRVARLASALWKSWDTSPTFSGLGGVSRAQALERVV